MFLDYFILHYILYYIILYYIILYDHFSNRPLELKDEPVDMAEHYITLPCACVCARAHARALV